LLSLTSLALSMTPSIINTITNIIDNINISIYSQSKIHNIYASAGITVWCKYVKEGSR